MARKGGFTYNKELIIAEQEEKTAGLEPFQSGEEPTAREDTKMARKITKVVSSEKSEIKQIKDKVSQRSTGENALMNLADKVSGDLQKGEGRADFDALLEFDPEKFIAENRASAQYMVDQFDQAVISRENLEKAKETLKILLEENTKMCSAKRMPVSDTPQIIQIRNWITNTSNHLGDFVDGDAIKLLNFRENYRQLVEYAQRAHATWKKLSSGRESVSNDEILVPRRAYARIFNELLDAGRIERLPRNDHERLKREHTLNSVAFCWTFRDCKEHNREYCNHWFWGIRGDDQSIALARQMANLSNSNFKIRQWHKDHQKPTSVSEGVSSSKPTSSEPNEEQSS